MVKLKLMAGSTLRGHLSTLSEMYHQIFFPGNAAQISEDGRESLAKCELPDHFFVGCSVVTLIASFVPWAMGTYNTTYMLVLHTIFAASTIALLAMFKASVITGRTGIASHLVVVFLCHNVISMLTGGMSLLRSLQLV